MFPWHLPTKGDSMYAYLHSLLFYLSSKNPVSLTHFLSDWLTQWTERNVTSARSFTLHLSFSTAHESQSAIYSIYFIFLISQYHISFYFTRMFRLVPFIFTPPCQCWVKTLITSFSWRRGKLLISRPKLETSLSYRPVLYFKINFIKKI